MLRRKVFDQLMRWKHSKHNKCIVLSGQRQVGKTFIVEEFGKTYPHFVELNFMKNPSLKVIFEGDLDVDSIISKMKLYLESVSFVPGETLILLDEIQECDNARTSLKFFAQDGRYDVIAAGSLIEVKDLCRRPDDDIQKRPTSVGFEKHIRMAGLDFEEFLWATGVDTSVIDIVKSKISEYRPLDAAYLNVFESRFRDFIVVGGMPEAVQRFVDTKDYLQSREVILNLIDSAKADINMYNHGVDIIKTVECYDSIPYQLDNTNRKFMYSRIEGKGSRKSAEKYGKNLLWIKAANHAIFCHSLYALGKPLGRFIDKSSFRLYLSDTGTLCNLYGVPTIRALLEGDHTVNKGAVTENIVAECLKKAGYGITYYRKSGGKDRLELDFVIETDGGLVAIEVKSGSKRECPSISCLDSSEVSSKIMFREGNIGDESEDIRGYPLFASAFINEIFKPIVLPKAEF